MLVATSCASSASVGDEDITAGSQISGALSEVVNQTDWAKGTRWTYETSFAGFPHAWVYRPASFSKKSPSQRALLLHLIGCGEVPYQVAQGAGWPEAAEASGMVIVIPEIIAPAHPNSAAANTACYNYGTSTASQPTRTSADHKAIIAAGTSIVANNPDLHIDSRQVYVAGLSAGAAVAMQVGCMAPDVFAGVISVAGPAIGSDQSQAVMPPKVTSSQIKSSCQTYAKSSPTTNAVNFIGSQVYVIVSDNNGLPAGNPVYQNGGWTADKFADQTYWDGDKYVPHAYHDLISSAMSGLLGVTKSGSKVALPLTGTGSGCQNGASSHDDTSETKCMFKEAVARSWNVTADQWTDSAGLTRLVHLEQDTLRHRWPSGPKSASDAPIYPDRQWLVDNGYFTSDGQFDLTKVNGAANGALGVVFFANDSFDFPMYVADFLSTNNPRLPAAPPTDPVVTGKATSSDDQSFFTFAGNAKAQGTAKIASVSVNFQGTAHDVSITSANSVDYSYMLTTITLNPGSYTATVTATDDAGHSATITVGFSIHGIGGTAPTLDSTKASVTTSTLTITGNAKDVDGDLSTITATTSIANGPAVTCTGTAPFTCTASLTGVAAGTYQATVTATDATGLTASSSVSFTVAPVVTNACFTAKNSAHISAKRAKSGGYWWAPKAYAVGSNDDLGYSYTAYDQTSSVQEKTPGYWVKVTNCP